MCGDMSIDMSIDMCGDMSIDMALYMSLQQIVKAVGMFDVCAEMCIAACSGAGIHMHVCRLCIDE